MTEVVAESVSKCRRFDRSCRRVDRCCRRVGCRRLDLSPSWMSPTRLVADLTCIPVTDSEVATKEINYCRYSGWQLGTDGVQSDDKFDMLASNRYVDIEQAVFLLECLIQEKDDSLKGKDKAILGLFISFVFVLSGPMRGGGVPSRNGLARVSFRVTSVIFSITVLGSIICYLLFIQK